MTDENLLIVCRSCGRKTLMSNMRPDSSGENMICVECYKKSAPLRPIVETVSKPAERKVSKTEKMVKYICTNCKYKFSRKESQHVEKCPYCGKSTIVLDNQLGADKLLHDSMDKKFETW